jgi:hypothetical protein
MKYSDDEKKCIRIIARWFRDNKDFILREDAIKELGVGDTTYDTLIKKMGHLGVVEDINNVMGKNGYAVSFRPSAYAEELVREMETRTEQVPDSERDCDNIIELLKKEYYLDTEDGLMQQIADITQDFISRGLFNSTICVSKQLEARYEHIDKLIEYILGSLEQNFTDIPLSDFKEMLSTIVEDEYEKLIPFANSCLAKAGLYEPSMSKQFKVGIINIKEKSIKVIETKCFIAEKQKTIREHDSPNIKAGGHISAGGDIIVGKEIIKSSVSRPDISSKTNGAWYQNRTIQAALIGLLGTIMIVAVMIYTSKSSDNSHVVTKKGDEKLDRQVEKAMELTTPPTLSFLKEDLKITKKDTGYTVNLVFKPSKNRPPLGPSTFQAKIEGLSSAKIIRFDETGSDHYRILSKNISENGKEAQFTYDPGRFEYPKVVLQTSYECRVQISGSHIPEPFFIDIE